MNEILECLKDGYATAPDLASRLGRPNRTVYDQLTRLEQQGLVERVPKGNTNFWKLTHASTPALVDSLDAVIEEVRVSDRVSLAEELVQLERRRIEILESLK